MNSYLVEGHIMLAVASELANIDGSVMDLTERLDLHQAEYLKQCGCPPSGVDPHIVEADVRDFVDAVSNILDINSSPDLLLAILPLLKGGSVKDVAIATKYLAGIVQAYRDDKATVLRKLETMERRIKEKSLKVCTDMNDWVIPVPMNTTTPTPMNTTTPTPKPSPKPTPKPTPTTICGNISHCTEFKNQCWCYNKDNFTEQREACGYQQGYSGEYYSIVSTGVPRDLIVAMGLPVRVGCTNEECRIDCATNNCNGLSGCYGASLLCWNDHQRWARFHEGIVRCRNYEIPTLVPDDEKNA